MSWSRFSRAARRPTLAPRGRLLNEFLISLGLFFLVLTANLVILTSASRSAAQAEATREALDLAREAIEETLARSNPGAAFFQQRSFHSRSGLVEGFSFVRQVKVTPSPDHPQALSLATVSVEWGQGRRVRLERYVQHL